MHRNRLSRSAKACQQTLTLPLFPEMTPQEVQYVCENLRAILGGTAKSLSPVSRKLRLMKSMNVWHGLNHRPCSAAGVLDAGGDQSWPG